MTIKRVGFLILCLCVFLLTGCTQTTDTLQEMIENEEFEQPHRVEDITYKEATDQWDRNGYYMIVSCSAREKPAILVNHNFCLLPEEREVTKSEDCVIAMYSVRLCNRKPESYKYLIKPGNKSRGIVWVQNLSDVEVYNGKRCVDVIKNWDDPKQKWVWFNCNKANWGIGDPNKTAEPEP